MMVHDKAPARKEAEREAAIQRGEQPPSEPSHDHCIKAIRTGLDVMGKDNERLFNGRAPSGGTRRMPDALVSICAWNDLERQRNKRRHFEAIVEFARYHHQSIPLRGNTFARQTRGKC
jgi:hypothetical protein